MKDNLSEKLIECEKIFDGAIVHLEKWRIELPNGKPATREIVRHVGASGVLALDESNRCCLVRQFRAPLGRITLEIPAGKLDYRGADTLEAAKRELSEETGITAEKWMKLNRIETSVGFCDEFIDLFLARGLTIGETHPDEDEFLELVWMSYTEVLSAVKTGRIMDSKTIVAVLMAETLI